MATNWVKQLGVEIVSLTDARSIIGDSDDYYVYIIWKTYVSPPIPFYVGKGHWQRLIKHEMKSEADSNIYKTNIINKHKKLNLECGYSIIGFYYDEYAALEAEMELIAIIGRADLNKGPLANKTDGGDGSLGHLALKGADNPSARTVIADGEKYPTLKEAGKALNISSSSVSARIKNGWDGYYYADEGQRPQTKQILGRYRKAVVVEGKEYSSASDAGRDLDMDVRMISKRISRGWEGYYYLDKGQLPRKTIWGDRDDKVAVIIKGHKYSTIAEAVRVTGESLPMISKRCLSSNFPEYLRLDGKLEEKLSPPKFPEQVVIKSKLFESIGKAAEVHNLTVGGVAYRCRSANYPDWNFCDKEKQKKESFTPEFSSKPVCVVIDGITFESQSSAAEAYNIDINTLKRRCKSISFPNWRIEGIDKKEPKDGRKGLIGVEIDDIKYRSISEASRKLGFNRSTIRRRADSAEWPNYKML